MVARNPCSYAWALHLEASSEDADRLSPAAAEGLDYATELAKDALERSKDPRRWIQLEPLTIEQLADEYEVPPAFIAQRIALARHRLFGELTDGAIYKRLQRQAGRIARPCKQDGCTKTIPVTARSDQRYCPLHGSGKERVKRSRRRPARPRRLNPAAPQIQSSGRRCMLQPQRHGRAGQAAPHGRPRMAAATLAAATPTASRDGVGSNARPARTPEAGAPHRATPSARSSGAPSRSRPTKPASVPQEAGSAPSSPTR